MAFLTGNDKVCAEIASLLGLDPKRCKKYSLEFPADGAVLLRAELYPDEKQLEAIKDKLEGAVLPITETKPLQLSDEIRNKLTESFERYLANPSKYFVTNPDVNDPQPIIRQAGN